MSISTAKDYRKAGEERAARERGRSLSHYSKKVGKQLMTRGKRGKVAPSKKAR